MTRFVVTIYEGRSARTLGRVVDEIHIEAVNMVEALERASELAAGQNHTVKREDS